MGVRNVTGQGGGDSLVRLSVARTPPEGAPKKAPKETAQNVRLSAEPSKERARQPREVVAPDPPVQKGGVRMRVDEATDRVVAQILNKNREVIKQIPPEELLKIVANVRKVNGLLFDQKT